MPKSRKRDGVKAHRKRVASRNQIIKSQMRKKYQMLEDAMKEQIEKIRSLSAETENVNTSEIVNLNTDGFIQTQETI
jgi:DNA-directed RNA polymerase beta subunit